MKIRHSELVEESQSIILGENSEIFRQAQDDVEDGVARYFHSSEAERVQDNNWEVFGRTGRRGVQDDAEVGYARDFNSSEVKWISQQGHTGVAGYR
jgi:hypothetical protein